MIQKIQSHFPGVIIGNELSMNGDVLHHQPGFQFKAREAATQVTVFDTEGKPLFNFKEATGTRVLFWTLNKKEVPTIREQFNGLRTKTRDKARYIAVRRGVCVTVFKIDLTLFYET